MAIQVELSIMGRRHLLGKSQIFDDEHDQGWNYRYTEQPRANLVRSGTSDNRSYIYPVESMSNEGISFSFLWTSPPRPNGYGTSSHDIVRPLHHPEASGPSHEHFLNPSTLGLFSTPQEHDISHPSSSNYNSRTWQNGGFVDLTMGSVRGAHKRKSMSAPSVCERGSSSRYRGDRGSSEIPLPSELHMEKSINDNHYLPRDQIPMNTAYRSNSLSVRGECSTRNVRSRPTLDLEASLGRKHLRSNTSLGSHSTGHFIDHVGSSDLPGQMSLAETRECNYARIVPSPVDITMIEASNFPVRSATSNTSVQTTGYHHGLIANENSIAAPSFPGTSTQPSSSAHGSFSHRSIPTYRASSSALHLGHTISPDERSHVVTETYTSRHQRLLPHVSWCRSERSGRRRSSYERFQPPFDELNLHDRFSPEGFMVADRHPAYYASRNLVDQHRDMRLDIDNMSYEELLALGERIGTVNTGLSYCAISKCLKETTYCSSLGIDEPSSCVICLEEYKEKEEIGELKGCEHSYHGSCIKKWLSMKNSCPICKAAALSDDLKNN